MSTQTKSARPVKAAKAAPVASATAVTPKAVVLPNAIVEQIINLNNAKEMIKKFEAQKEAADAAIRAALGDATVGIVNGEERIKLSARENTYINQNILKESFPEAFEAASYKTPFTVLVTK